MYFHKGDGDEARTTQLSNGFGNKPLAIRLCDDSYSLPGFCIKFICSLCLKVVEDNSIERLRFLGGTIRPKC